MSKFQELFEKVTKTQTANLNEARLADGVKEIVAAIKEDETVGSVSRREMVADLVAEFAAVSQAEVNKIQMKLSSLMSHKTYGPILAEVMSVMSEVGHETAADLAKLREKLLDMVQEGRYDDKNKMRRFIDALKKSLASISDDELKKLYDAEVKLQKIVKAVS